MLPSSQGQRNSSMYFNIDQGLSLCVYVFDRQEGASIIDVFVRNFASVGGQVNTQVRILACISVGNHYRTTAVDIKVCQFFISAFCKMILTCTYWHYTNCNGTALIECRVNVRGIWKRWSLGVGLIFELWRSGGF